MKKNFILIVILLAVACVLPFVVSNYRTFQLTLVLVYAIALLGLNILTGYSGQISLGHGAFYALGAYCAAILIDKAGVPYWATLPAAGAVCFVAGFLFGLVRGASLEVCGRLGALAAAEVISHIGARPQVSLAELARQNGLPV